ncbi:hypothetical protein L1987_25573 [Smallanthus sonchifolius]|uniref:Uncharacterized protein n=1 Tax=Smallanthus sonchifolius TaxID=185202 RepID=A0ACB9I8W7_9ASTR|nr:hypothetical protein L1987_25573 [Smallanthus sonchifolius]
MKIQEYDQNQNRGGRLSVKNLLLLSQSNSYSHSISNVLPLYLCDRNPCPNCQVIGVIDVNRSKVKDGFCDEVKDIISGFLNHPFYVFMCVFHSLVRTFLHNKMQQDELRQIYEELPEFLEEGLLIPVTNSLSILHAILFIQIF